jgi:outer membrane immunogenic protein
MRKFLLAAIAAVAAAAGPVMAADMGAPVYKAPPPPPPAPVYNWTGFYVGAGAGYGMWDLDTSTSIPLLGGATSTVTNNGGRGWVGQVVAGYDYQFPVANFNLVAGVFGDYDFGHVTGSMSAGLATSPTDTISGIEKERSSWAVGGRLGWLITPQILTYWNGGYTEARFDGINLTASGIFGAPVPAGTLLAAANTYHGWFTGGGVETQVSAIPGLFFNTEYRYSSYSSATLPLTGASAPAFASPSLKLEPHVQTVMGGLRYKFNWTR